MATNAETNEWSPQDARLKLFLARLAEGRTDGKRRQSPRPTITKQQASILAALKLMDQFGGPLQHQEIARLLQIGKTRLSNALTGVMADLVVKTDSHYRITPQGSQRLAEYVDHVLGAPSAIERKLRTHGPYRDSIAFVAQLVDDDLRRKFELARNDSTQQK
jgi:hypothetical protein